MPRTGNRAAIYTRVSTQHQAEKHSLPAQRRLLRELATSRGWTVVQEYEDAGISGATLIARPAFLRVLADAAEKKFDYLLAIDLDRISRSRDLRTWAEVLDVFRRGDIRIVTPGQELDPEKPEDIFLTHIFGAVAALEKSKIAQRARRGKEQAVRDGQRVGGTDPYGYQFDKNLGKLVIIPEEARALRLMFDLYEQGLSQGRIAKELEDRGILPRSGKSWWRTLIRQLLMAPVCTGFIVWRRTAVKSEGRCTTAPDEWIWSEEPAHEAIIDIERWRRVQALRKRRSRRGRAPTRPSSDFLLTGLMRCFCGERMCGRTYRYEAHSMEIRTYRYYHCTGHQHGRPTHPSVKADEVEEQVIARIAALAESPEFLDRARKQILLDRMRTNTRVGESLDDLRGELERVREKQSLLYEDRLERRLAVSQWERFHTDLVAQEEALAGQIDAAERALLAGAGGDLDIGGLLEVLRGFRAAFGALDALQKKQVLSGFVSVVRRETEKNDTLRVELLSPWRELADGPAEKEEEPASSRRRAL